jgi:hypothetical protein
VTGRRSMRGSDWLFRSSDEPRPFGPCDMGHPVGWLILINNPPITAHRGSCCWQQAITVAKTPQGRTGHPGILAGQHTWGQGGLSLYRTRSTMAPSGSRRATYPRDLRRMPGSSM